MTPIEKAKQIRSILNNITSEMTDNEALEKAILFPEWNYNNINYKINDRVLYNNKLYKVLQNHTSQIDWNPQDAISLFTEVLIPDENEIPDWIQPDSTNPYMENDKVQHNEKIWQSEIDNNVWEPGVYGWFEIHV